jgi:CPA2 family monovalent cation:H+ antiporter-2
MHAYDLILTLTGGLVGALIAGYITHRLKLSPIVGYLLAGVLVGPYTPGFVADHAVAEQLAEVGVILLMFGVGLQFRVEELLAVRRVAVPGAIVQSAVATGLGVAIGFANGWSLASGVVFGVALSVASTVVLVRMLGDTGQLHTPTGHIAVGWLVVEDLFTVLVLVLMPALVGPDRGQSPAAALAVATVKVVGLIAVTVWVGGRAIPWMLTRVARTRSRELFTLAVLATALGIAVASAKLFGVSMALGAFLAGLVVGRSDFSLRAAADALPMRDAFAVLFFVSVGMLLDPGRMIARPGLIAATMAVIMVGKPLAAFLIVRLCRQPARVGLGVAAALGQIGEFSFIVATLAYQLGVMTEAARDAIVGAAILSITANPFLFRTIPVLNRLLRRQPERAAEASEPPPDRAEGASRAVVVGYGPVGRTVTRLLGESEIRCTIVEMNIDTVRALSGTGIDVVHGDATHEDILQAARLADAQSLIISTAGLPGVEEMLRAARRINPRVQILARTGNLREAAALRASGADEVFSGEGEVALAFAAAILGRLGATAEQIDRERARVHAELN